MRPQDTRWPIPCQQQSFAFPPITQLQQSRSSTHRRWQETQLLLFPLPKGVTHHRPVRWIDLSKTKHDQHGTQKDKEVFAHGVPGNWSGRCINAVPNIHVKVPVHLKNKGKWLHIYQRCSSCFYQGKKCFTTFTKLPEADLCPSHKWG